MTPYGWTGNSNGSRVVRKMQVQHGILRECIEQLKIIESLRATLITYLRKALNEQESKFEQVHQQLQVLFLYIKLQFN
ncbi:hypothetical protein GW17_00042475 [Ensete ventricosum]|nr:hypothetical protein GW17_00042475 [Ensete ventricosum]